MPKYKYTAINIHDLPTFTCPFNHNGKLIFMSDFWDTRFSVQAQSSLKPNYTQELKSADAEQESFCIYIQEVESWILASRALQY